MSKDEIRTVVMCILGEIAPEADLASIKPGVSFRDQLDIDSIDFLHFVIALHKELHLEIPEADYVKLATLDGAVQYIASIKG
jgi:acyl carrier protein